VEPFGFRPVLVDHEDGPIDHVVLPVPPDLRTGLEIEWYFDRGRASLGGVQHRAETGMSEIEGGGRQPSHRIAPLRLAARRAVTAH
jgi:hypothetical protein